MLNVIEKDTITAFPLDGSTTFTIFPIVLDVDEGTSTADPRFGGPDKMNAEDDSYSRLYDLLPNDLKDESFKNNPLLIFENVPAKLLLNTMVKVYEFSKGEIRAIKAAYSDKDLTQAEKTAYLRMILRPKIMNSSL